VTRDSAGGQARIGVDVGGTFTDCILVHNDDGAVELIKVPTVRANPARSALDGIERLLERGGVAPQAVTHVGHGTTVATNTLIEEDGAEVGVLTTAGFRDVLALGRVRFPRPSELNGALPRQLVPLRHVREVPERMSADGAVVEPLDEEELVAQAAQLIDKEGVSALAVCFLHAYRNDAHERQALNAIKARWPDIFVCASSEISRRPREYERFLTTAMNAYVGERMRHYLSEFQERTKELGIPAPPLVTRSNGGIMSVETAGDHAVHTMLSGPAAGLVGATYFARAAGYNRIIAWDMGGTSLDVAVLDGTLKYTDDAHVGEFPLFIPTLDVLSIGSGGGSIAWLDASGLLHVGPRSAGAQPGPACYGRGGQQPTLTDAYVTLGVIDAERFAGSELRLDRDLAVAALRRLGDSIGLSPLQAAEAVVEVATAQIQARFMPLMARYGVNPANYVLFPYGGAGPMHSFTFAKAAGIDRVVVPLFPGLLCAWGSIIADLRYEVPKVLHLPLAELDPAEFAADMDELDREATRWLGEQGVEITGQFIRRSAYARYMGQSFDLQVPLPGGVVSAADIRRAFIECYATRYGYADPDGEIEIVSVSSQAIGTTLKPDAMPVLRHKRETMAEHRRRIFIEGAWQEVVAIDREAIAKGDIFEGPMVVDQIDTTMFIPSGFRVSTDGFGNLVGERIR